MNIRARIIGFGGKQPCGKN